MKLHDPNLSGPSLHCRSLWNNHRSLWITGSDLYPHPDRQQIRPRPQVHLFPVSNIHSLYWVLNSVSGVNSGLVYCFRRIVCMCELASSTQNEQFRHHLLPISRVSAAKCLSSVSSSIYSHLCNFMLAHWQAIIALLCLTGRHPIIFSLRESPLESVY